MKQLQTIVFSSDVEVQAFKTTIIALFRIRIHITTTNKMETINQIVLTIIGIPPNNSNNNHMEIINTIAETSNSKEEEMKWGLLIIEGNHIRITLIRIKITIGRIAFMDRIIIIGRTGMTVLSITGLIMVIKIILGIMKEV